MVPSVVGRPATLAELLAVLDTLDADGTIFAARPWTAASAAVVVAAEVDDTHDRDGLGYLLEVDLAREVAQVWSDWRGGTLLTTEELCRAVIHYAEYDAWEPVRPRSREDFVDVVEAARGRHPSWFDLPADQPPSPAQVERVERELGCRLAADYVWFCERYGGGDVALARVRSMDPASDLYIGRRQSPAAGRIVVADDGTGLEYCFPVVDGRCVDRLSIVDTDDGSTRDHAMTFLEFVAQQAFGDAPRQRPRRP